MLYEVRRIMGWLSVCLVWALMGVHGDSEAQISGIPSHKVVALQAKNVVIPPTPTHMAFETLLLNALSAHPNVRSALAQAQGAQLDVDVAKWAFWPSVSVNAQRTDELGSANQGTSNFTVQQPLWSGGALTARVDAAQKLEQAGEVQVDVVRGDVGLRLVDAWASLLDAEVNRAVTARTLEGLFRYQGIMQRRVSVGLSSAVELRLLSVRVTRAQTDLADAQVSIEVAAQRLKDIAGTSVSEVLSDLKTPIAHEAMGDWVARQSVDAATHHVSRHPALRKAELDAAAAADQLAIQKSERWPKLVLSYQRRLGSMPTQIDKNLWALNLNYTPGAGLANVSQSAAEAARLEARLAAIDALRQEKLEQVRLDWYSFQREFDRRASLEATISSARDVLASYERLYFGGLKTWLEVLNALQEVSQSQLRLAQAGNATTLAYYRWRLRGGQLPTDSEWNQ
jgi:outer membrane protein, adhesin transport system